MKATEELGALARLLEQVNRLERERDEALQRLSQEQDQGLFDFARYRQHVAVLAAERDAAQARSDKWEVAHGNLLQQREEAIRERDVAQEAAQEFFDRVCDQHGPGNYLERYPFLKDCRHDP